MNRIVAIGGGEKTPALNHALEMRAAISDVLIIPTACSTERAYDRKVPATVDMFRELGVGARVLHEYGVAPTHTQLQHEIGNAALIYTIGGNSPYMIKTMREHGSDSVIKQAIEDGTVHAGTSAGALLPFELGWSCIAKQPAEEEWEYEALPMLGAEAGLVTAHANQQDPTPRGLRPDTRLEAMLCAFPENAQTGLAIDNGAAVVIDGDLKIIRADKNATATRIERDEDGQLTVYEL